MPYSDINIKQMEAVIVGANKEILYNEEVFFPEYFSEVDAAIVASKYFNRALKENSLTQLIDRVSEKIVSYGFEDGYFGDEEEAAEFLKKLKYYQIHQYFAFNSPVYFNVGIHSQPQTSACFILKIDDNMNSIARVLAMESNIFKRGSGSGINLSTLRSSKERLSFGGYASGPVSFLKVQDVNAGVIKSGGTVRRSAKLVALNIDHPDIEEFISCKVNEEKKLRVLAETIPINDPSDFVFYQNTNLAVRLTDDFMRRVLADRPFYTKMVTTGERYRKYRSRDLLYRIAEIIHTVGEPGIQFHDTINRWNTCRNSGEINSSNPCGEFLFLDNTSCNLASVNLLKFVQKQNGTYIFDFQRFEDVIKTVITAQDIIIDRSYYPAEEIAENSRRFRPLGLGFSNLGGLLMYLGIPYDSNIGRLIGAGLAGMLTSTAYLVSSTLARTKGSFEEYGSNCMFFTEVLKKHLQAAKELSHRKIDASSIPQFLFEMIETVERNFTVLEERAEAGEGFRNAQVTCIAPTGTISFLMGCATTGIEPEYLLVKEKLLFGHNSSVSLINPVVRQSLENLGYVDKEISKIIEHLMEHGHLENCPVLSEEHLPIFDTAVKPPKGTRAIDYQAHVKMVAEVQPFVSMGISKTVNLPKDATVEDIYELIVQSWKMGLKGLTIYRDGSKVFQPLTAFNKTSHHVAKRRKLPPKRQAITEEFRVGNVKGYITTGLYEDGSLGEFFIKIAKQGSTLSGLLDCFAIAVSIALQYGVPLSAFVKKLAYQQFEPSGFTSNPNIPVAKSLIDYIMRHLGLSYLNEEELVRLKLKQGQATGEATDESPVCPECGAMMTRKGQCYQCLNCGNNDGTCG